MKAKTNRPATNSRTRRARPLPQRSQRAPHVPIRILTAVPICDGHDSAILTINLELVHAGIEVIYLGYHRSVRDIVRAAIQEDVRAIGLSSYNGGHVEFFSEILAALKREGAAHVRLFGGGGGTITPADAAILKRREADEIFFAGTPLKAIVDFVKRRYGGVGKVSGHGNDKRGFPDIEIAKLLTKAEVGARRSTLNSQLSTRIVGIAGPGGAGKSTLIDELALRYLRAQPRGRLAILSHDPSAPGRGALLGDRATMVYAQHDRVFMRSAATRGHSGGLSKSTRGWLQTFRASGFDLVLVESAGIGQEDSPFARGLVDMQILVLSPDYGGRLQLQKIAMLDSADVIVINKSDRPGSRTALAEVGQRLELNARGQKLIATVAKRHRDSGVDKLFGEVRK